MSMERHFPHLFLLFQRRFLFCGSHPRAALRLPWATIMSPRWGGSQPPPYVGGYKKGVFSRAYFASLKGGVNGAGCDVRLVGPFRAERCREQLVGPRALPSAGLEEPCGLEEEWQHKFGIPAARWTRRTICRLEVEIQQVRNLRYKIRGAMRVEDFSVRVSLRLLQK